MKETSEKEKLIQTTSQELFFKFGVKKVTVEEICSICKISKKTFYKYYSNKYELVKVLLDGYEVEDRKEFEIVKKEDLSFKQKLIKLMNLKLEKFNSAKGIFYRDIFENCTELKSYVDQKIIDGDREFFEFVSHEQANKRLRTDVSARFISYLLTKQANTMLFDPEMDKMFPDFNTKISKIYDSLLNGVGEGE